MDILLIRHGIAEPRDGTLFPNDSSRPLTAKGMKRMRRNATGLRRLVGRPDQVWTSPLLRARQTAEIVVSAMGVPEPVRIVDALSPGASPDGLWDLVSKDRNLKMVAWVGHEPSLSQLLSLLIGGGSATAFDFRKGGGAYVSLDGHGGPPRGRLLMFLPPRALRRVDRRRPTGPTV